MSVAQLRSQDSGNVSTAAYPFASNVQIIFHQRTPRMQLRRACALKALWFSILRKAPRISCADMDA
jgi:hypothetical protein